MFISYSSINASAAQAICHILEENGIRCWIAPRNIPAGAEYGDLIDDAIRSCKVLVVVFSETASSSRWVKGEINIAVEEQKTIIPFRIDPTPAKGLNRLLLNQKHWIDAYPDYETKFSELVDAVITALPPAPKQTHPAPEPVRTILKFSWKYIICIAVGLLIAAGSWLIFHAKAMSKFEYNNNGLHVSHEGLTEAQQKALTSILDNMVLVEGGSFMMGNTSDAESFNTMQDTLSSPAHKVALNNFYIGRYEITQSEWKAFLPLAGRVTEENDAKAMDRLSWEDAKLFADTLSVLTGLNISLPTEAQWEYAACGGVKTRGYMYSGHNYDVREVGWSIADEISSAEAPGLRRPNELGLYDMTGNVSEWCADYFAPYDSVVSQNPSGPDQGMDRVLRGGDFLTSDILNLKATTRYCCAPFTNRTGSGVRLVIIPNNTAY